MGDVEAECIKQAINVANLPVSYHHVALMPDTHVGYGMPVGGVAGIENALIPYAVGNDIGCGVSARRLGVKVTNLDQCRLSELLDEVAARVPVGPTTRKRALKTPLLDDIPNAPVLLEHLDRAEHQLGTLGSGNHFIEFQSDEADELWVMIHSGSRNLGLQVCTHYHQLAKRRLERAGAISQLGDANLAWLEVGDGGDGDRYLAEMGFCLRYARENRRLMMEEVLSAAVRVLGNIDGGDVIDINHNYAALEQHFGKEVWVHRKGAVKAGAGELVLVPGSMATSSYVGRGRGLAESFQSSAHGAGRRMSRGQSKRSFTHKQVTDELGRLGIVHRSSSSGLVEESGWSYKDVDAVMSNQSELVEPVVKLKPLAVLKG